MRLALEMLFKVGLAEFLDDVEVVRALEHVIKTDNVGRFQFCHDLYFRNQCGFEVRV